MSEKTKRSKLGLTMLFCGLALATPGYSQQQSLDEFLEAVDRTPVSLEGKIYYDRSEDIFRFINGDRESFGVSLDAGRDARENVEEQCEMSGFFYDYEELCTIKAAGTVEIRGGRVFLSIEELFDLSAQ